VTGEPGELAALRDAFPGYRFRRRDFRGVPGYVAEARWAALRRPGDDVDDQAVVTAYRDEGLSLHDCAVRFGISQRRVAAVLERHGVPRRPVGRPPRRLPAGRPGVTARK
jgi:hypothetical protein